MLNAMHGRSSELVVVRERLAATDPRLPDAFVGLVAFGATLAVAVILARLGARVGWGTQLATMAVAVGFVCWWCRVLPSIFVAVCGWLMLNGIVVNGAGSLGWDGHEDAIRVGVLLGAGLAAAMARTLELRLRLRMSPTGTFYPEVDRPLCIVHSEKETSGDRHA